jgi:1-deoxyxylulose-5-phosphate synthase
VNKVVGIANEAGMSPVTLAVAWVLANPAITAPLIGASRADQLSASIAAADVKLPAEIKKRLDDLTAEYRKGDSPR